MCSKANICVLGSVSKDYFYVVDEWPLPSGITNKASHYYTAWGGKGANCAVMVA